MDKRVMDESQLRGRGKKKGDGFEWRIGGGKLSDTGIRETEVKTQDTKKKSKREQNEQIREPRGIKRHLISLIYVRPINLYTRHDILAINK